MGASAPALLSFNEGVQASLIEASEQAVVWTGLDVEIVGTIAAGLLSKVLTSLERHRPLFLANMLCEPGD